MRAAVERPGVVRVDPVGAQDPTEIKMVSEADGPTNVEVAFCDLDPVDRHDLVRRRRRAGREVVVGELHAGARDVDRAHVGGHGGGEQRQQRRRSTASARRRRCRQRQPATPRAPQAESAPRLRLHVVLVVAVAPDAGRASASSSASSRRLRPMIASSTDPAPPYTTLIRWHLSTARRSISVGPTDRISARATRCAHFDAHLVRTVIRAPAEISLPDKMRPLNAGDPTDDLTHWEC